MYLVRSAEICPRLRRASAVMVDLDVEALGHPNPVDITTDLEAAMSRLGTPVSRHWSVKDLCFVLRSEKGKISSLSMDETAITAQFGKLTRDVLANSKVHAEVQILAFLDSRSLNIPPRVICASKKACFLCNAFVRCHVWQGRLKDTFGSHISAQQRSAPRNEHCAGHSLWRSAPSDEQRGGFRAC